MASNCAVLQLRPAVGLHGVESIRTRAPESRDVEHRVAAAIGDVTRAARGRHEERAESGTWIEVARKLAVAERVR